MAPIRQVHLLGLVGQETVVSELIHARSRQLTTIGTLRVIRLPPNGLVLLLVNTVEPSSFSPFPPPSPSSRPLNIKDLLAYPLTDEGVRAGPAGALISDSMISISYSGGARHTFLVHGPSNSLKAGLPPRFSPEHCHLS